MITQRQSVFNRLIKKNAGPKMWAEHDLRRLINTTIAGKAVAHTPRDLAKRSLGEQNGSPFTPRIAKATPAEEILYAEIQHIQRSNQSGRSCQVISTSHGLLVFR